jgi:hypothetical protein
MKHVWMMGAAMVLASMPAHAWVKVTNLSGQPQSVTYSSAGNHETQIIAPDATEYFRGVEGMLAINGAQAIEKAQRAKSGVLSEALGDVAATNRASRIPTEEGDVFVIWPDGRMLLQKRLKNHLLF